MKESVIQLLPSIRLTGGTARKVKLLADHSKYRQVICYVPNKEDAKLLKGWNQDKYILEPIYTHRNIIKNIISLSKLIDKYNAKIIHGYFPIDSISMSILKIIFPQIKIIRSFEGALNYPYLKRKLQLLSFYNHNLLIGISKFVINKYKNDFSILRKKKIELVYNSSSFSENLYQPIYHSVKEKHIVTIGCCNPTKNTETIIKTAKVLKDRGLKITFELVGDGNLRTDIERLIKELQVDDIVHLKGYSKDVREYLDKCSLYIHPANLEGFGMAVIEAMSRCCAIIVSDSCALPELINDGEDGLIAKTYDAEDWANKIEYLLSNQKIVDNFGIKAHKKANEFFSVEKYISQLDTIYDRLYNKKT